MPDDNSRIDRLETAQLSNTENMTKITVAVGEIATAVKYEQAARQEDKASMKDNLQQTLAAVGKLTEKMEAHAGLAQDISTLKENTRILGHDLNKALQSLALLPEHDKAIVRLGSRMDGVETQGTETKTKLDELAKEFANYKTDVAQMFASYKAEVAQQFTAMTTKVDTFKTWIDKITGGAAVVGWGGKMLWLLIGSGGITIIALIVKQIFGLDIQITEEP